MQVRAILAVVVLGTLVAACGSGTSSPTGPATMNVRLVDAPSSGYQEVNVDVRRVEIASDGGWIVLGTPNRVVNLLALTGGVSDTLVDGATLPAGRYGQMRLVLGPDNSVKLLDGTVAPLKVPSGQQSGVKLIVNFDVRPGTTADVYIDFDAHRSVFVHEAGASGKYILRPTVRAFDRLETGSISGTFTVAGTLAPLPGAVVTAQTVTAGTPAVVRSTITDAAGRYVLDLLPRDGTYFVVSQPVTYDTAGLVTGSYEPRASAGLAITATTPVRTFDASFTLAAVTGGIAGAIAPVALENQADSVDARLPLDAGGVLQSFIVRNVSASVTPAGETYAIPALPATAPSRAYTVVATRKSVDSAGGETFVTTSPKTADVAPGAPTTADIAFAP
ncbi:MAG: hypothetical protein RJA59_1019 [Pseudomonadota bacterium]